ncbi:hypothetical protein COT97_01940 [Candidatus Falkowbacteria bacterium CG10_big_fil_rev_8_21_14_0_10_39_11]|uniref:Uncharacterized protein n=1 Tax=Candidatus Falkowbacteria bacterium CG10_big_fil_rev_8_21_14_0_10_39_11 TaxID=1974565 RepID=A0A2H0V5L3_9BACT|nr:MAG: hypothetical protein COT97_01940 [Candidatus Falkowbacteria bacterium CG10_big_fil_rev_8_21_14_0_10_39_11]
MQNICIPGNEIGESCTESWECLTDNCVDGTCRCDDDEQCPANQRCVQDSTLGGLCVELRPYGEICEEDNQCVSQVCRRDPELGKKICNCNGDNDCPSGKSCQFVPALPLPIKQCR